MHSTCVRPGAKNYRNFRIFLFESDFNSMYSIRNERVVVRTRFEKLRWFVQIFCVIQLGKPEVENRGVNVKSEQFRIRVTGTDISNGFKARSFCFHVHVPKRFDNVRNLLTMCQKTSCFVDAPTVMCERNVTVLKSRCYDTTSVGIFIENSWKRVRERSKKMTPNGRHAESAACLMVNDGRAA